ncbi:integration host factor, actinobacterial type [Phytomonospora sp. NPDC050363]|uniref:integration host factor, actinobacterial type n=1 Tax=Phytomonospora sp. NPDC050363 TaxID=3155642 RepID=UPI0033E02FDD
MALPTLTPEQRTEALAKAAAARAARAKLKTDLGNGTTTLAKVFKRADDGDDIAKKTKVIQLVKALPGIGDVRAAAVLEKLGIADSRRVGGLGTKQREGLLAELG